MVSLKIKTKTTQQKNLFRIKSKYCVKARPWDCPFLGPTALQTMCWVGRRPWSPTGTAQRREMGQATPGAPPWLGLCCAPTEVPREPPPKPAHKTSPPSSTAARLFEGQLGIEPQTSLFQNRILAGLLVKFLISACCCFYCCCCCLKKNHPEPGCGQPEPAGKGPSWMHSGTSTS